MKAQHIRPRVQNGPITRRKPAAIAKSAAKPQEKISRRSRHGEEPRHHDARVFWMMVLAGTVLTAGFVLGLRSQINAHQLSQSEEKLRDQLDRYASQQKYLTLDQQRALSPAASEHAVKEAGLAQLKLDRSNALPVLPAKHDSAAPAALGLAKTAATRTNVLKPLHGKTDATKPVNASPLKEKNGKQAAKKIVPNKPAAVKPASSKSVVAKQVKGQSISEQERKKESRPRLVARVASRH